MAKGKHAWHGGSCMVKGGVHGEGGHVWQRGSMHGMGGHAWRRGACMVKGRHAWQERRPLQRAVRILLECILVFNIATLRTLKKMSKFST